MRQNYRSIELTYVREVARVHWVVLLIAFGVSLLVRSPHIGRPLSAHHEFCTALTLIFLENWKDGGFQEHKGAPSLNFKGAADRYIHPLSYEFATRNGALYYLSFPPFAYYVPHLVFSVFGIDPAPLPMTWFSLMCHALTVIFLVLAIARVMGGSVATIAGLLYLFMPASAWFHGTFYMSDSFVQLMWAIHLHAAVICFTDRRGVRQLAYFGVSLAFLVYTYWLGVFVATVHAGIAAVLSIRRRDRSFWAMVPVATMATVIPIAITVWQYSAVIGLEGVMDYWWYRFQDRATMQFWTGGPMYHLRILGHNYVLSWLPLLFFLPVAALLIWLFRRRIRPYTDPVLLSMLLFPVLIDHAVFLKHAGHDFGALKAGFLLCAVSAWCVDRLGELLWKPQIARAAITICLSLIGIWLYFRINPVADGVKVRYDRQMSWGHQIARTVTDQEIAFAMGWVPEPQEQWYARRNIKPVKTESEALDLLEQRGFRRGVIFIQAQDSLIAQPIVRDPF